MYLAGELTIIFFTWLELKQLIFSTTDTHYTLLGKDNTFQHCNEQPPYCTWLQDAHKQASLSKGSNDPEPNPLWRVHDLCAASFTPEREYNTANLTWDLNVFGKCCQIQHSNIVTVLLLQFSQTPNSKIVIAVTASFHVWVLQGRHFPGCYQAVDACTPDHLAEYAGLAWLGLTRRQPD